MDKFIAIIKKCASNLAYIMPAIITFVLVTSSSSATCWYMYEDEAPETLEKYRLF